MGLLDKLFGKKDADSNSAESNAQDAPIEPSEPVFYDAEFRRSVEAILKHIQDGNLEEARKEQKKLNGWLNSAIVLVPIFLEGDTGTEYDHWIHVHPGAVAEMNRFALQQTLGTQVASNRSVAISGEDDQPLNLFDKRWLRASEEYAFPNPGDLPPKKMFIRTFYIEDQTFLYAFTDFEALHAFLGSEVRVGIYPFSVLAGNLNRTDAGGRGVRGILVNPGTTNYLLPDGSIAVPKHA